MSYNVIERIGQGGFGVVDKVEKEGNIFALKRFDLHPAMAGQEQSALKRFLREAKFQKLINHENVVPIFEVVENGFDSFYVMPYAESTLVKDITSGYIHSGNFERVFIDVIAGLEFIHKIGITHRDLKPANILRIGDKYAIGDFGLMALNETNITSITNTGVGKGSDFYTAPEITSDLRNATACSDIYSLGCLLHDFVGDSPRIPCNEIREINSYQHILLASTRTDPRRRFKSVVSFRDALSKITKGQNQPSTAEGEYIVNILKSDSVLTEELITQIANFLSSSVSDFEKSIVLDQLDLEHIDQILKSANNVNLIASALFEYARTSNFPWDFTDTLTQRLVRFVENTDTNLMAEGIMALLYLGVRHNRWYVERIAYKYLSSDDLPDELIDRLTIEFMVDEQSLCDAIKHLACSISISVDTLNSKLRQTVADICGH